jgi:hypothetical protein
LDQFERVAKNTDYGWMDASQASGADFSGSGVGWGETDFSSGAAFALGLSGGDGGAARDEPGALDSGGVADW